MARPIGVVNLSTVVSAPALTAAVAAVQYQLANHVCPAYKLEVPQLGIAPATMTAGERVIIADDTTQVDALGFHEVDGVDPVSFVFAATDQYYGVAWPSTLSHELSEDAVDPWCDEGVWTFYQGVPVFMDKETSDPTENDEYRIASNPSLLSNFVLPAWFRSGTGGRYDFLKKLTAPLTVSPGGYFAYSADLRNWTQVLGQRVPAQQQVITKYSRRSRRIQKRLSLFGSTSTGATPMAAVPQPILDALTKTQTDADLATAADATAHQAAASAATASTAASAAAAAQLAAHQQVTADVATLEAAINATYEPLAPTAAKAA